MHVVVVAGFDQVKQVIEFIETMDAEGFCGVNLGDRLWGMSENS